MPLSPQDLSLIEAKIDAKLLEQKADVRLNTQALADLKTRFEDLAKRLADVPTDIATLKERVSHLPGKGFVVGAGITTVTALTGILILLQKLGVLT